METPRIPGVELGVELGRGAHSIVYRGAHGGAACAVKVPRARARWTRWIYREAVALARVKHRGLPAVLEVGEVDQLPFLVMELVEGETLADRLVKGPLSATEAVEIGLQLADVLAAVHDVGLVHRDVKPRNIVMERGAQVRLVDFGFATPMERTGDGETAGTAAYAAPEQLVPPGRVDARSDLYCIGRVLLECLIGDDFRTFALTGDALVDELVRRGVGLDFASAIRHLVAAEPHDRYADARLLAHDLEAVRAGAPISGPTAPPIPRALTTTARAVEMATILDAVGTSRSGGRLVLLEGTRGSGKTRLLSSLEYTLRPLARTISMRCVQADPPLATIRRFLEACVLHQSADAKALDAGSFEMLVGNLAPIAKMISPRLGLGADAPVEAFEATDAMSEGAAEIVIRLARHYGRLVAIVDDIQWMDRASADILVRAALRVGEAALALVLGSRNEPGQRPRLDAFLSVHGVDVPTTEVTLPPLSEEGVSQLVASHLGTRTIEPSVVTRIHAMADGTPLGVLEILGAFLDAGALRPHGRAWIFAPERLEGVKLPSGALALLGRRLADIPAATRRVLETAAIWGSSFRESQVAATLDVTVETIGYASVNAKRAGVIESIDDEGGYRFVHDSLRETLLDELADADKRRLHQRAAELLADVRVPSFEDLCAAARHFAAGEPAQNPGLVHRIAAAAAAEALKRGDNEATLELQEQAVAAAKLAGLPVSSELVRVAAEAHLRRGAIAESLHVFHDAMALASDPVDLAALHGRVAWAHASLGDSEKAWEALDRAFHTLGERMPVENAASAFTTTFALARPHVGRLAKGAAPLAKARPEREVELLCSLHSQNVRLAVEYGKPGRLIQSGLISHTLSSLARSPATRARARVVYGFLLAAVGRRDAGMKEVEEAFALGQDLDDATTAAYCAQIRAVTMGWSGRFDEMVAAFHESLEKYGTWSEVAEYLIQAITSAQVLFVMGRNDVAWEWMEKSIRRTRRTATNHTNLVLLLQRARGMLASLGRSAEPGSWLEEQLAQISIDESPDGMHRLLTWGPRATYYYERGDLGPAFERLVADFDAEKLNPRTIHLSGSEYYIVIAHARVEQCFAAPAGDRKAAVANLAKVTASLRLAARVPPLAAHARFAEGCLAWFQDDAKKSRKLFTEAETLASAENVPWVTAAVARARAHILRTEGKLDAALDQARVAETLSRQHGAIPRARAIAAEFGLAPVVPSASHTSSISRHSSRTTRQLAVLLNIVRGTRREQKAEEVATSILDELVRTLAAERGAIWFQPEVPSAGTAVTRHRHSTASVSIAPDSPLGALLRDVHHRGVSWPADRTDSGVVPSTFDPARMLVVPLHLYEQPVGALAMERSAAEPEFGADDRQLLDLLAHQVPIALEIARLLSERERLHASLQQSQKLEAIGQLAGGLAHDFNNMLAAMKVALGIAQERAGDDAEMRAELDIIGQATTRASQLTSQLLTFSRSQPLPVQVHDVNQLVVALEPMLRRVAIGSVEVKLALSPIVDAVSIDAASFDQALMNLLINARDAMPNGGTFTISTRNVVLDETTALRANLAPGAYVEVEVADTGEGMSPETMNRIFEPFFTTKPVGRGTGLGLATVWGFVKNCGGGIDVWSELGRGTRFTLYLKRVDRPRVGRRKAASTTSSVTPPADSPDTILVVDDDDLVRRSIAKILERNGYRVVAASGSAEAIDVARSQQGKRIALVIMDVLLPGVTGPELGRRLNDLMPARILFVSGFSAESAPLEDAKVTPEMLLQKPFTQAALLARVRELMPSA